MPMLDLEQGRAPVEPSDAATIIVLRDASGGPEVYCVKRHVRSGFLGGAVVFPGGKLSADDAHPEWTVLTTGLGARAGALAASEASGLAFAVAGLRELFEEAALLTTTTHDLGHEHALALRERAGADGSEGALRQLLRLEGLRLDTARLEALARWVTPQAESRRYDTRFYLLPWHGPQVGRPDRHETTEGFWATPAAVLQRWELGEVMLAPPTSHTLALLASARSVTHATDIAAAQSLDPLCPHFAMDGELAVLALPGDPLYPGGGTLDSAAGPTRFVLRDGRFVPERA